MADTKLSALNELAAAAAVGDEVYIRDVSEAAADESKRITVLNLQKLVANLDLNGFNIAFPATQVTNAGANVLDDYEEFTFTVTLQDDSASDAESQAYSTQVGRGTKNGNRISWSLSLTTTSIGSLTGSQQAVIAGFPVASANETTARHGCVFGNGGGFAVPADGSVVGNMLENSTIYGLKHWDGTAGPNSMTVTEWSANGSITGSGVYETAS